MKDRQSKRRAYTRTRDRILDMKTRQLTLEDSMMKREQYVKFKKKVRNKKVSKVRKRTKVSKKA